MLATIKARQQTDYPVRFVLQTGDAVLRGATGRMWNVSYTPIIERLTKGADIPYFLTAGNHDIAVAAPGRSGPPTRAAQHAHGDVEADSRGRVTATSERIRRPTRSASATSS